jgi:hypothetical protein
MTASVLLLLALFSSGSVIVSVHLLLARVWFLGLYCCTYMIADRFSLKQTNILMLIVPLIA